jgi:tRNA threonylcarbamoyladenosine biosynthesis protein TsaE
MNRCAADEQATNSIAAALFAAMPDSLAGWTILLEGELGAGKSTFARAFIRAGGYSGPVPSPTYTLIEPYSLPMGLIYHIDLYRVSNEEELRFLGWGELDDGCRLIEWPERVPSLRSQADLCISLAYDGNGRRLTIDALSERGHSLIEKIN